MTADPAGAGDLRLVVDGTRWRMETRRLCTPRPRPAEGCRSGTSPWIRRVDGREPFSDAAPVPLELVNPVDSFTLASDSEELGRRPIAGRTAVGVRVTAAQIAPFLAALSPAGDLRAVHPADAVDVWLDAAHLVPLEVTVRAGAGEDRARWAAARSYADEPGAAVLSLGVDSIRINGEPPDGAFRIPPAADETVDGGFTAGDPGGGPAPDALPPGFRPHLSGTAVTPGGPTVAVRSWTDGRAWLKVRSTRAWAGGRLFGDLGRDVRVLDLGPAGRGYAGADGQRVALHGDGVDVVVSGSVSPAALREVAAGLGVVGRPVPAGWDEAAVATLGDARAAVPGLLVPAGDLPGFGAPGVRIVGAGDAASVTQTYAGAGDRGFVLTRTPGERLPPPSGPDVAGVVVRGVPGRYSVERGELEWIEDGAAYSLASRTLPLGELVGVAAGLEAG